MYHKPQKWSYTMHRSKAYDDGRYQGNLDRKRGNTAKYSYSDYQSRMNTSSIRQDDETDFIRGYVEGYKNENNDR